MRSGIVEEWSEAFRATKSKRDRVAESGRFVLLLTGGLRVIVYGGNFSC